MSEIYDNSELGETYRGSVQDTAFPIYEENVPVEEDPNDLEFAYDQLTLFEKLKDNRWQVRRKAYCELLDFFESGKVPTNHGEDELQPETMVPWIQNMINEPNMIAMVDALKALNAFLTHHTCSRPQLASFTGRLVDKLVLTKKNIQSNIVDILEKLLEGDEANNITNEILKRLDNKNPKFLVQLLNLLLKHIKSKEGPDDAMTRIIFKAMLPLMSHSNKEPRHLALEILRVLYSYIEEDFTELKGTGFGNLRHVQLKELEEALQNAPKAKGRRLVKLNDGTFKAHEGALKKGAVAQKVDLLTLIPEKFLEVPYLVQSSGEYNQNEKKKKLEEFNQRIEQAVKTGCEIETHKDYSSIINLLIWMLEDKNILINTEAIKSIDHLVRILKNNFPQSKLKYILTLIVEKLDAKKKTTYNTSLIQVLDDCIAFNCMVPENLCELLLYNGETNKNMNVRTSCLNWFGSNFITFLTAKRDVLYANMSRLADSQRPEKPSVSTNLKGTKQPGGFTNLDPEERIERLLAVVYKKIQQIHKKEGNITLKKRCQQILDSLENLYARAEVISPPKEDPEKYNALNDISSIKGNSKVINISNLTLQQGEYDEFNKENEYEESATVQHERTNRFEVPDTKRSEFAFENLKQAEKDQFAKLVAMFGEIKPKDEHAADKLDEIGVFVDKMNMEVLQACQKNIAQNIKRTLRTNATDYRNIVRVFESANNLLIKINKICLEIHSDTLKVELKVMLLFLANLLGGKNLEKTLDSMYMTCSIDKFLSITLELFEKVDTKYVKLIPEEKLANALRVYLNWLVVKVEKVQNVMFEEELLKGLERAFSQFRFNNIPQVHLGVSNILGKRLKTMEEHAGNTSVRSYQTPKINKHKKTISVDTSNIKEESRMDDLSEIEQKHISQKMTNIQEQAKSDVKGGLEKFSHLLSSLKKKSLDKLNMSHCMSPTPASANTISPNRHWKRGLGRDSTPKMSEGGRFAFGDSIKKQGTLQGLSGKEDSDQKKHQNQIDVEEAIKFLNNICVSLTEKEMASFELSLFKLKSLYTPKDYLHILNSITPRLLARDCFNTRISEARIIKMLKNHLESLDKTAYLRTLKALFCMKARENDMETAKNTAKVGLDLTSTFFGQTRFPHKVAPIIVEMVVYSLTVPDLRSHAEEILDMITKSVGRDGLRRIFEVELISSTKLYQIFINWVDQQQQQQQPFGALLSQAKREISPLQQQSRILEEENETHTLIDDSFNNSITPQKQTAPMPVRRKSPTVDLRHSFDKALEEAEHQDLNQLSQILNTEDNEESNFGASFGTRRVPETEQSKGLLDRANRFETTDKRERHDTDRLEYQGVPSFAQFKQSIKNDFGTSDFTAALEERERDVPKKVEPQHQRMGSRPVLGERNMEDLPGMIARGQNMGYQQEDKENVRMSGNEAWFGKGMGMKKEERDSTPEKWKANKFGQEKEVAPFMPSREMVVGHQMDSIIQENKENMGVNTPQSAWYGQGMVMKKDAKDGSAEKWKGKYIQEKERLQQTIELLEKANSGYLNHVTEKTDLLGKLNSQRQMNEALYDKFNNLASENEKLKKDVQTFEAEREKMSHQSLLLSSTLFQSKQDYKKFLNMKFITEALPIAAKGQSRNKEEFIKQFQEILLVSDNLELEVGESLMKIYEDLEEYGEKVQFVVNLKDSVTHPQVLGNLSSQNHKFLLEIALKLCVSENTQREIVLGDDGVTFVETDLTNEMQLLLDGLLRFHSMNATISNLLRIISDQMPTDFDSEMSKSQKMLLKLGVKCLVKLSSNFKSLVTEDIRVFDVLVEIYKLFKLHPPENLKEGQPNLKDFEVIFRNIRTLADHIIDLNPNKAKEFSTFFTRENNKSIFLDYVKSYTTKYYPNLSSSMNLSHASFE